MFLAIVLVYMQEEQWQKEKAVLIKAIKKYKDLYEANKEKGDGTESFVVMVSQLQKKLETEQKSHVTS